MSGRVAPAIGLSPLSELPEQIEHFGRNVLADDSIVGGAEGIADVAGAGPLAAGARRTLGRGAVVIGFAPAAAFPVVGKAQNLLPLAARSAAPAASNLV